MVCLTACESPAEARRSHTVTDCTVSNTIRKEYHAYGCVHPFSHAHWSLWFDITDYAYIGENLAQGFETQTNAHKALMASPTHRANILDKDYQDMGVGSACGVTVELFGGEST